MPSGVCRVNPLVTLALKVGLPESNLQKQRRKGMDQCERKRRQSTVWSSYILGVGVGIGLMWYAALTTLLKKLEEISTTT